MRRQSISASKYAIILDELIVTSMHANVMMVTIGTHEIYGRVVLVPSRSVLEFGDAGRSGMMVARQAASATGW